MIPEDLLNAALEKALARDELSGALARLEDADATRARLEADARARRDRIERAASPQLQRFAVASYELASLLEASVVNAVAAGDGPSERFVKLRRYLADLTAQLTAKQSAFEEAQAKVGQLSETNASARELQRATSASERASSELAELRVRVESADTDTEAIQEELLSRLLADSAAYPSLNAAKAHVDAAREDAVAALVDAILQLWRPDLTKLIEEHSQGRYDTSLAGAIAEGLSSLPDREREVETTANDRLDRVLKQLDLGGSIGISGPRGAGKTTLIRSACNADVPPRQAEQLSLMVYAPVKYAPQDFVLHLFETACRASLPADDRLDPLGQSFDERIGRAERAIRLATRLAIALGLALGVIGVLLTIRAVRDAGTPSTTRELLTAGGLGAVALVVVAMTRPRWRARAVGFGAAAAAAYAAAAVLSTIVLDWDVTTWAIVVAAGAAGYPLLFWVPQRVSALPQPRLWQVAAGMLALGAATVAAAALTEHRLGSPAGLGASLVLAAVVLTPAAAAVVRNAFILELSPHIRPSMVPRVKGVALMVDRLARTLVATGTVVAIVGLALVGLAWLSHPPTAALGVGLALALAGGAMATLLFAPATIETMPSATIATYPTGGANGTEPGWAAALGAERLDRLEAAARSSLQRIKYQRAFSAGWSTKVGLSGSGFNMPLSAEAGRTGGRTSSEQAMTLPEVVTLLRDFLQTASTTAGGMRIGIDELDKMSNAEDAERFLNDIKAIFGIQNCHFLISVSEDAVASFERRGMPFRDVFDSAFDDVLRVQHLTMDGTAALLSARTIDMPMPFKMLCHALAGGLPRDVIRVARRLFDLRDESGRADLAYLARALAASELAAKQDGTVTAASRLGGQADATDILRWLGDALSEPDTASLQHALADLPRLGARDGASEGEDARRALDRLVRELAAYWYLCATLVDVFCEGRTAMDFQRMEQDAGPASMERLARARQAFTIDPGLAWHRVSALRNEWNLVPLDLDKVADDEPPPEVPVVAA